MTSTNVYQGLSSGKSTSRVLQAPGGGSSNIFGHYEKEAGRQEEQRRQEGTAAVMNSMSRAAAGDGGSMTNNFQDNRDSYAANQRRNHGESAPFATSGSLISTSDIDRPAHHQQVVGSDFESPQKRQEANRMRNHGTMAPFATGDSEEVTSQKSVRSGQEQQTVGSDYQTPQQRQANNPNKAANSFSNLFGDTDTPSNSNGKLKGKVDQYNPVTWSAKPGGRAAPTSSQYIEFSSNAAGLTRKSVLADEGAKAMNPNTKDLLSPNHCLAVRDSPITWSSPFLPAPPTPQPKIHKDYTPDLGILPTTPQSSTSHIPKANTYQPSECIIPISRLPQLELPPRSTYLPHESIIPQSPSSDLDTNTSSASLPDLEVKELRNPLTGQGVLSVPPSTIKCFNTTPAEHRHPFTWSDCDQQLALISLENVDIPLRSKGQGVRSQQQVSTHNPVTWEAYSNFDSATDHPQHRSRYENYASAKAGTFNPITGQDHDGNVSAPTRVTAPPGGKSSIQF